MSPVGYVYILVNGAGRSYVGSCVEPERRLHEHQGGFVKATAAGGPWRRVGLLAFESPTQARKAECWLKRLRRREYLEQVLAGSFAWPARFGCVTISESDPSGLRR